MDNWNQSFIITHRSPALECKRISLPKHSKSKQKFVSFALIKSVGQITINAAVTLTSAAAVAAAQCERSAPFISSSSNERIIKIKAHLKTLIVVLCARFQKHNASKRGLHAEWGRTAAAAAARTHKMRAGPWEKACDFFCLTQLALRADSIRFNLSSAAHAFARWFLQP